MQGLAIFIAIVGLITTVLWLLIGWRAMTAHERLADSASHCAEELRKLNLGADQIEDSVQRNLYNKFLAEANPDKDVSQDERNAMFKSWKAGRMEE